jgi:hypothetical protein
MCYQSLPNQYNRLGTEEARKKCKKVKIFLRWREAEPSNLPTTQDESPKFPLDSAGLLQQALANMAHALDAGVRLCFIPASLARASDAQR